MYKRLFVFLFIVLLSACSSNTADSAEENINEQGTRTNPAQLGEPVSLEIEMPFNGENYRGVVELTIDNVIKGQEAVDYLNSGYSSVNDIDDEGAEWVVFDFKYDLVEGENPDAGVYAEENFAIYNTDGSEFPQNGFVYVLEEDEFPEGDLYPGGTLDGKIVLKAPKDESFLIAYNGFNEVSIFFDVPN